MKLFEIDNFDQIHSKSVRAPTGFIFHIDSIIFHVYNTANNAIIYKEEWRDIDKISDPLSELNTESFLEINTDITGNWQFTNLDLTTKYVTVGRIDTGTNPQWKTYGYGKLVKATRTQLLIEWFRKAR